MASPVLDKIQTALEKAGFDASLIERRKVRLETLAYMLYWHDRLSNKLDEQARIESGLKQYLMDQDGAFSSMLLGLGAETEIKDYVEKELQPVPTVDLVCIQGSDILSIERSSYPKGPSLIGGIINDDDESNALNVSAPVFAALRVAAQKILQSEDPRYAAETDQYGNLVYMVSNEADTARIKIYPNDRYGYTFRENLRSVIRPSDTRHIVYTIGFKCFAEGEIDNPKLVWREKEEMLEKVVFEHHREIISHVTAQSSLEAELQLKEKDFIRGIIESPLPSYESIRQRFKSDSDTNASFPELFPVVNRLLAEMYSEDMNAMCKKNPLLIGARDKATISLRHVSLKNKSFCPYLPTLRAIFESIAFFDIAARLKRGFYDAQPADKIIEHNPKDTPGASYHMYRYKYRLDEMLSFIPEEIVIPTFESLSATDLMKVRGVPIRFVGLSTDFLYVDEFEQSPEEFLMHDCNHSWRMIQEDRKMIRELGISRERFFKKQCEFISEYISQIKIKSSDTEFQKEMKKLKKIILFEIVHEDARPFLKDVIGAYIQVKEGGQVPFEVPHIDKKTGYMDIVETLDTGISTLSYVRNKLQHGFYDQVDAQLPQIVSPQYRKAKYIALAAYDMLTELKAEPVSGADTDSKGNVSYEWLMRRTCSVGPDNIHNSAEVDEALKEFGDGAELLNPKRYQA